MREWYTAIQIIKEKPFTGFGLSNIEKRMLKNTSDMDLKKN
jgi:O-antigen ligase